MPMTASLFAWLVAATLASVQGSGDETGDDLVCQFGCWDGEDLACHSGLNQNRCAEIYGHVGWARKCECVDAKTGALEGVAAAEPKGAAASIYFSVPAFVVLFRESLEVMIVLAIIMQFLTKSREDGILSDEMFYRFRREVYFGATVGFAVVLAFGIGFLALAAMTSGLFTGDSALIFDFVMMMITCFVLSFLALNFYKMIHTKEGHERKMKQKVEATVEASRRAETGGDRAFGRKHAFFVFAFTTGMREGMESIVFLVGVVSDLKDMSSLPLPIISALVAARLVGCCFFQGTKGMRVDMFMRFSAILLLFISAGFFASAMHNLQELVVFGTWAPRADRPWQNQNVWDATGCCNDKTNRFFVLMRALVGWQDQATPVELFAWCFYWLMSLCLGFFLVRKAKKELEMKVAEWRMQDEAAALKKDSEKREESSESASAGPKQETIGANCYFIQDEEAR